MWQKIVGSGKRRLALLIAILLLVVGSGSYLGHRLFVHHQQTKAKHAAMLTAQSFVAALNHGTMHQAYMLTSDTIRQQVTEQEFGSTLNDLHATSPVRSQETIRLTAEGATYSVAISGLNNTRSGRTTGTFRLSLLRTTDGSWRVAGVTVH